MLKPLSTAGLIGHRSAAAFIASLELVEHVAAGVGRVVEHLDVVPCADGGVGGHEAGADNCVGVLRPVGRGQLTLRWSDRCRARRRRVP